MNSPDFGFLERRTAGLPYVVYHPSNVKGPLPAILFLHGRGESGMDGLKQVIQGIGSAVQLDRSRWPFLIVLPQKPDVDKLWPEHKNSLNEILGAVEKEFPHDPHRRYITGLSQGGHGTFNLAARLSWNFAAAAPICGWCDPVQAAQDFRTLPMWAFHGEADTVVTPDKSEVVISAINKEGGRAKLTTYPGVGHNSWDKAYREEPLGEWFLKHSLD